MSAATVDAGTRSHTEGSWAAEDDAEVVGADPVVPVVAVVAGAVVAGAVVAGAVVGGAVVGGGDEDGVPEQPAAVRTATATATRARRAGTRLTNVIPAS
jgi:hypothetical protein